MAAAINEGMATLFLHLVLHILLDNLKLPSMTSLKKKQALPVKGLEH
jgi:hypothetical protein